MKDVWKVYFNGSFGSKSPDGSHPGQVLKLNQKFRFAGRDWYVPAAYLTAKGLVLDILMRADKAALEDFCKKTKRYSYNADHFRRVVDSVETKNVLPGKIADVAFRAVSAKRPKYVYNVNRNFLLRLLNALPQRMQVWIIAKILK